MVIILASLLMTACNDIPRAEPSIIPVPEEQFEGTQLSGSLTVEFIGLDAGEATLVRSKDGTTMLIDTGHPSSEKTLLQYLRDQNISDIGYLVLTHFSEDYIGNVKAVLDSTTVDTIVTAKLLKPYILSPEWGFSGKVKQLNAGERLKLNTHVEIIALSPRQLYLAPQNNSLVFQLKHNKIQFLFTSAINKEVEQELMEKYDMKTEIVKVSDFGSSQGSFAPFIEEVDPQVAVLFHPSAAVGTPDEVLERLHETWTDVYRIKKQDYFQTIKMISNGDNYEIIEIERES